MSTPYPVCMTCHKQLTSHTPLYRKCDQCRTLARTQKQIRQELSAIRTSDTCTICFKKISNLNPQYRRCDQCRALASARQREYRTQQIQQQSVISRTENDTCIPENLAAIRPLLLKAGFSDASS